MLDALTEFLQTRTGMVVAAVVVLVVVVLALWYFGVLKF
jgi:ABC-type multidrug transport system permease subunit